MAMQRFFPMLLVFCGVSFQILTCEEFSPDTFIELNRERRDVIESRDSHHNLKVFDHDAMYGVNKTVKKKHHSRVTESINETPVTAAPINPTLSLCRDLQEELGRSAGEFIQCAIMNARPITICIGCRDAYNSTVHAYQQLMKGSDNSTKCRNVFFGKDRLEVVDTVYGGILNLWTGGHCDACYETKNGKPDLAIVSNQTLNFFDVLSEVRECFEVIRSMDDASNNTCTECKPPYQHLSNIYSSIVAKVISDQPPEVVCGDVVDAMNDTRHIWNNQFRCKVFNTNLGYAMYVLTASLCALPILFYVAGKVLSNVESIPLVLPKRKFQDNVNLQT